MVMKLILTLLILSSIASGQTTAHVVKPLAIVITTSSLPLAVKGKPYNAQLTATGGKTPYTWTLKSGQLPTGLSLSSSGLIQGTPTATGTFKMTVKVQ